MSIAANPEGKPDMKAHWDGVYRRLGPERVSWYQPVPTMSLELVDSLDLAPERSIVDVGGGASAFAATLTERGHTDLTVVDISAAASAAAAGSSHDGVCRLDQDILSWEPPRRYDLWHDRAVFHFLTDPDDRARYRQVLHAGMHPGSYVIVATFAPEGPDTCSGLPVCRYCPEDLVAVLGDDLELIAARQERHTTPAMTTQAFTWVLASIVS